MSNDITFCDQSLCLNVDCPRNVCGWRVSNAKNQNMNISMAALRDTEDCPGFISSEDIVNEIKGRFPDYYWEEEE